MAGQTGFEFAGLVGLAKPPATNKFLISLTKASKSKSLSLYLA
jgi:hypothetical protein